MLRKHARVLSTYVRLPIEVEIQKHLVVSSSALLNVIKYIPYYAALQEQNRISTRQQIQPILLQHLSVSRACTTYQPSCHQQNESDFISNP